ncbi:MAG: hypothetical protein WEE89_03535 [Gemmatimonadota bacterium]
MTVVRRLIVEAHRRSLWQVFTVYAAVSWAAYQVLDALPGLIGVPASLLEMAAIQAIALDSGFAMAYRKKGAYLSNSFRPQSEVVAAYSAAYRLRAQSYERANQPDSAIAYYEKYLDVPRIYRPTMDATALSPTLLRLGELYDTRDNAEKAKLYYARTLEPWKDADPPFQARLVLVRARLAVLTRER